MARILQITQLGHPVLRHTASRVENIQDRVIQELIDDMLVTVGEANGVGLAAPQVYQSLRIFIVAPGPNPRYPDSPYMEPTAMINPEIVSASEEVEKGWEGCLSIPGIRGLVNRYATIEVKYTSRDGETVEAELSGFIARIFQHELDHLDGIVFFDRMDSTKEIFMEKEWLRMMSMVQEEGGDEAEDEDEE
ncbi:MAG: peptide deformylase [bacterium]|nr:peptide deformylase [bacterium]